MSEPALTAEALFERHFAPLYPADALADLARARTIDANPADNPRLVAQLEATADVFAKLAPEALRAPGLALDFTDASVHRLAAAITPEARDRLLVERPAPGEPPMLVTLVVHGALYLGACVVRGHAGRWLVRRPAWESQVELVSRAGTAALAPLSWWLRALSDEEIGEPRLADRYRTFVEVPTFDADAMPRFIAGDRRIPRLAKVRYDTLHQHLRAHAPEVREVGADFPSPERVDELAFRALDFAVLGDGRMLLVWGLAAQGVHLYWLGRDGFLKGAYYPADSFPEPVVQLEGDRLRVVTSVKGRTIAHEMLWWGP